ncbi:MAG: hypothetical protein JWN41_586 [Thermoleophilia bacterium]|nr:hypothetical protein [Thermoleophilia bacterium]
MADPSEEHPSSSSVQNWAEGVILDAFNAQHGTRLAPSRLATPDGGHVALDGMHDDHSAMCEVWAHQGPTKPAHKHKVVKDAFKLLFAREITGGSARLMLLFACDDAAKSFQGKAWYAEAMRAQRIEVHVVQIPDESRVKIRAAQVRQKLGSSTTLS